MMCEISKDAQTSESGRRAAKPRQLLSNEALFRAQAEKKEREARLPLATKLKMLKEMADWAEPLEKALKQSDANSR
jgi:hypothetical protein